MSLKPPDSSSRNPAGRKPVASPVAFVARTRSDKSSGAKGEAANESRGDSLIDTPASGFEAPFEMLAACHERVQRSLSLLERLRAHVPTHGADAQAQDAAADVLRYFDRAAPAHHEDEERHVFPLLLRAGQHVDEVRRLQAEHLAMARAWVDARAVLAALSEGRLASLSPADDAALDGFVAGQAAHLALENEAILPTAQALIDAQALRAMAREMATRRGLP